MIRNFGIIEHMQYGRNVASHRRWGTLILASLVVGTFLSALVSEQAQAAKEASSAKKPLQLPVLNWQERSDWINVKTDINPPALGDGKTDDTAALQKAFDSMQIGQTLYFPSGNYRITSSLTIQDPKKGRRNG